MCGIAGVLDVRGALNGGGGRIVAAMAETLAHRGPDDSGVWEDRDAGVALGFRRLAILDLSPTGRQPMRSADGRFTIVFNGEIYNYRELRAELVGLGHAFRGSSDTEVILAACSQWGPEAAVPRLWGMFAIALWDTRERTLLLARDRVGKKPLYLAHWNGGLLFASELKALRAVPGFPAEVDRDALALYARFGYFPAPWTVYRNVRKLRPGWLAVFGPDGEPRERPYWDAAAVVEQAMADRRPLSDEDAVAELDTLLRDAVGRRMIADVPLGAFLSGGIDSSTVVALMQAQSTRPVKTFSIGFREEGFNEAEHAALVARHLGTEHTELYVTPGEARNVIPRLPEMYDEPFADPSQIPTYLVSALAREHVTVALSGDGGDELFGGYNRYLWAQAIWRKLRMVRPLGGAIGAALRVPSAGAWDALNGVASPLLPRRFCVAGLGDKVHKVSRVLGAGDPDVLYMGLVSLWTDTPRVVLGSRDAATALSDPRVRSAIPRFEERMMFFDLVTYLPDDILAKVDRASMAVSLEARCPLLDHRVVEWAWRLPPAMRIRKGRSKWLLRKVLDRYIPPGLVERPKMGFGVPIDAWLRGPLRGWAEELLAERRLREEGFFEPGPVREAWTAHLSGRRNDQYRLWVVLMFQAWSERWLR